MLRKVALLTLAILLLANSLAFAEGGAEIILRDTGYGALIGGLIGAGWYLVFDSDDNDHRDKMDSDLSRGIGLGILAGFAYGVGDSMGMVAVSEDGAVKVAAPRITLMPSANGGVYVGAKLFNASF